eukprot:1960352-Prymnesium_polylepis.1
MWSPPEMGATLAQTPRASAFGREPKCAPEPDQSEPRAHPGPRSAHVATGERKVSALRCRRPRTLRRSPCRQVSV